jgi:hypothetical protein
VGATGSLAPAFSDPPPRSATPSLLVAVLCAGAYAFAISSGPRLPARGYLALAFEIVCWGGTFIAILQREPEGLPRISDPGVQVLFWSALYLIVPSIQWARGGHIPLSVDLTQDIGILLLWLHGLFLIGFAIGYLVIRGRGGGSEVVPDRKELPRGWLLFGIPLVALFGVMLLRLASGGGIFPRSSYGQGYLALQVGIRQARSSGGFAYIWVQILSKAWFYPVLLQGIGAGLLLIHARQSGRGMARIFLLLSAGVIMVLLLGSSGRSTGFLIPLIALVFVDLVSERVRWRRLTLGLVAALVVFLFFGYVRPYLNKGLGASLSQGFQAYSGKGQEADPLYEFSSMFGKEAIAVRLTDRGRELGAMHLVRSVSSFLPAQVLPPSLQEPSTAEVLSRSLLGKYSRSAGVAGASVGEGYRFGGVPGVVVLGCLIGLLFGFVHRWVTRESIPGIRGPVLGKAAIAAGIYAWAFNAIRGDLADLVIVAFYYGVVAWVVVRWLASPTSVWRRPIQAETNAVEPA